MKRHGARLLFTLLLVAAVGLPVHSGTWASWVATSENQGNTFASGTVSVADNDGDAAMLSLSDAQPGASDTACIKVTYGGSLPSAMRLHGATTGTGLDQYLDLRVTRGVYSPSDPSFDSCTNFQADATDYIGAGAGVVYNGTLQGFGDDWTTGLVDPTPSSPESWTTGEAHVYKLTVTLQDNVAAEGQDATQTFTWEARSQ